MATLLGRMQAEGFFVRFYHVLVRKKPINIAWQRDRMSKPDNRVAIGAAQTTPALVAHAVDGPVPKLPSCCRGKLFAREYCYRREACLVRLVPLPVGAVQVETPVR